MSAGDKSFVQGAQGGPKHGVFILILSDRWLQSSHEIGQKIIHTLN